MPDPPSFSSFPSRVEVTQPTTVQLTGNGKSKLLTANRRGKRDTSPAGERRAKKQSKDDRRGLEREVAARLARGGPNVIVRQEELKHDTGHGPSPWEERPVRGATSFDSRYADTISSVSSHHYFIDTVGEKAAVKLGESSSRNPPRFYRDGRGVVVGFNEGLRILRSMDRTERGLEVAPRGKPYVPRYTACSFEGGPESTRIVLKADTGQYSPARAGPDIILFGDKPKKLLGDADALPAYRAMSRVEEDDDDLYPQEGSFTVDNEIRQQVASFEHRLRLSPGAIDIWIEYSTLHMRFKPDGCFGRAYSIDTSRDQQTRADADVTLAILSRAMSAHPDNEVSSDLLIAQLRAAETIWTPDRLLVQWKKVIRECKTRVLADSEGQEQALATLWLAYIGWREGEGLGASEEGNVAGGMDEVVADYLSCLEDMQAMKASRQREENQVYLFLRACLFLKQAGYNEKALASFQALVEITLFKPAYLRPGPNPHADWFDRLLEDFERFWDSDVPRIGETGGQGWADSISGVLSQQPPNLPWQPDADLADVFGQWYEAERRAGTRGSMPTRTTDLSEMDEDDPFRVVLFSDIRPFLFPIRDPEVRLQLVYAFLCFLGLPFPPADTSSTSMASVDPRLRWTFASNEPLRSSFWPIRSTSRLSWQTIGGEPMEPEQSTTLQTAYTCPIKSWAVSEQTMFARPDRWFRDLDRVDLGHIDLDFAQNAMNALRPLIPDPLFTSSCLALQAALSSKSAVKSAKKILASERDNPHLWDGYARLERQRGNISAARTVYSTALQVSRQSGTSDPKLVWKESDYELLWSWVEMEYFEAEEARAMRVLLIGAEIDLDYLQKLEASDSPPSALDLLKARQYYSDLPSFSAAQFRSKVLFRYLADGAEAARDVALQLMASDAHSSFDLEFRYQFVCELLHTHCSRHPSPLSLAREVVQMAIRSFPNNTQFLSLYFYGELGGRVHGRVQRLTADLTKSDGAIVGILWSVWAEAHLAQRSFSTDGGGGAERVRQVLDRGIRSQSGRQSVALWMLYIEFEGLMGRSIAAKKLCYRAVATIGGCKELYLLPFSPPLRQLFTPRELKEWAELMTERGIRMRVPFEQYFNTQIQEEQGVQGLYEDEGSGNDLQL